MMYGDGRGSSAVDELPESRSLQESISYSGRKTVRAKSELRRRQILEATLRIAAKEGIRGIKHRTVAHEAGVPLASTTYYFRDINELITDAFMLFAETAQRNLEQFYYTVNLVLDNTPSATLAWGGPGRHALARRLTAIASAHIADQFTNRRNQVLAEQVFLMEALRDDQLAALAQCYRDAWIAGLAGLLSRVGSRAPRQDAALLVSAVLGMGYDGLLYGDELPQRQATEVIRRMVSLIIGVTETDDCKENCPLL